MPTILSMVPCINIVWYLKQTSGVGNYAVLHYVKEGPHRISVSSITGWVAGGWREFIPSLPADGPAVLSAKPA